VGYSVSQWEALKVGALNRALEKREDTMCLKEEVVGGRSQ